MVSTCTYKRSAATLVAVTLIIVGWSMTPDSAMSAASGEQQSSSQQVPDAPQPQNQPSNAQQQPPDAPSATRSPSQFPPGTKPAPANGPREPEPPVNPPQPATDSHQDQPPAQITTAPPTRKKDPAAEDTGRESFSVVVNVNLVTVPVTVKDRDNRLVDGLLRKDFVLYEDGVRQNLKTFTSDPFPLSAAVVIDDNIASSAMKKINETLPMMAGAFSQFDEVAVYTYGDNVHTLSDFTAAGDRIAETLRRRKLQGRTGGVPDLGGPLQSSGPSYNGHPMDPGAPHVITPAREFHVMNDALLRAAQDLSKRDRARRKIIFLISDGKEDGSEASYRDVLKVLLSYDISVYAIGVDTAAIPVYDKLAQVRLPGEGYGNLLPKYVSATGGEYFAEFTRGAIEQTYAKLTETARNQYTLGYTTRTTPASTYRTIEVRVLRPDLKVVARDGYYPLPPRRTPPPENPPPSNP